VEFSSLDFMLHTKALLSTINYMNSAIPQDLTASKEKETKRRDQRVTPGKTGGNAGKHLLTIHVWKQMHFACQII